MLPIALLVLAFVAFGLSRLKLFPKGPWMEIGFALAAAAAILQLVFPVR